MQIRRPLAAILTALALTGGGVLTACSSPTSSTTGTPADNQPTTSGTAAHASIPHNSNRETTTPANRNGGANKGNP